MDEHQIASVHPDNYCTLFYKTQRSDRTNLFAEYFQNTLPYFLAVTSFDVKVISLKFIWDDSEIDLSISTDSKR